VLRRFPKAYTWPATIRVDEQYAGFLEGGSYLCSGGFATTKFCIGGFTASLAPELARRGAQSKRCPLSRRPLAFGTGSRTRTASEIDTADHADSFQSPGDGKKLLGLCRHMDPVQLELAALTNLTVTVAAFRTPRYSTEKAAGTMTSGLPGSKLIPQ
jgi:hypothetical protein